MLERINLLFKETIIKIEASDGLKFTDIIGFVHSRPFNMKGQEFEDYAAHLMNRQFALSGIDDEITPLCNKNKRDLVMKSNPDLVISVKNYNFGRIQIGTFPEVLKRIKSKVKNTYSIKDSGLVINDSDLLNELIVDIQHHLSNDFIIFALSKIIKKKTIKTFIGTLKPDFLNIRDFNVKLIYADRENTPHWRIQFFAKDVTYPILSFDLGTNALNRGLWLESGKIKEENPLIFQSIFIPFFEKELKIEMYSKIKHSDIVNQTLNYIEQKICR